MTDLIYHSTTKQQIDSIVSTPSHGILIVGQTGIGKKSLALYLAESLLGISNFTSYSNGLLVTPEDGKAIVLSQIRELQHFLTLKVISENEVNRAAIIEDAHLLTLESQNALLKTLEEPPAGTVLILTTNNEQALLPTLRSRLQKIQAHKPPKNELESLFSSLSFEKFNKTYAISAGLPGLFKSMIENEDHPLIASTALARKILSISSYDRLIMIDEISKDRNLCLNLCLILQQMAELSLKSATGKTSSKWENVLKASYEAYETLLNHGQTKLTLISLMLSF